MTRSRTAAEDGAICRRSASDGRALDAHQDVDAVQQRAREAAAVAGEVRLASTCSACPPRPHGHGFEAATSMKRVGKTIDLLAADDRHVAVLERLAQRLEARARELRELVEEQHAAVRERRLARLRRVGAADEPGGRDRVVRRAERPRGDQARAAAQARRPTGCA